jgi:hypothetical protein
MLALNNFYHTLSPGGIMILKLPNLWSVKGLITKFSPHWFHILYYRRILGRKDAGRDDTAPFKTFMKLPIGSGRIKNWSRKLGLECVYEDYYAAIKQVFICNKIPGGHLLKKLGEWFLRLISLGKVSISKTELIFVIKHP